MLDRVMTTFAGWTLAEAMRRCVDAHLFDQQRAAHEAWRSVGKPTRIQLGSLRTANPRGLEQKRVRNARDRADAAIPSALRTIMADGRLVATGRRASPTALVATIPAAAWPHLRIKDHERSVLEEQTNEKARIFDVQVYPVVHAPNAPERLAGKTLVEVFRDHLLGDPEVAALAASAIAEKPEYAAVFRCGRCYPHGQEEWTVDWGHFRSSRYEDPSEDFIFFDSPEPVRPAERALADRFRGLVDLLRHGKIVATGIPARANLPATIPRSVWSHESHAIDAINGDLVVENPEPRHRSDHHFLLWSAVMLEPAPPAHAIEPTSQVQEVAPERAASVPSSAEARAACLAWLSDAMRQSPHRREHPKQYWKVLAFERWPGKLSERGFDLAWRMAIDATGAHAWSRSGAPKKK